MTREIKPRADVIKSTGGNMARTQFMRTTPGKEARRERRRAQRAQDKATRRAVQGGYSMAYPALVFMSLRKKYEGVQ